MDSFELNKVAGAVLGTLLFAMGTGFVAELIYSPKPAGKAGYDLPVAEPSSGGGAAAAAPKDEPIAVRLASADAAKGKGGTKPCQGCHSFEKGGPNMMGPDLWQIVERKKGSHEGYDYSAGMKEKGGAWTYDDLDHFLTKPSAYVKGTKMAFQGIASPQDRANVIAYLRTLDDSPKPLPAAPEAKGDDKKSDDKAKADDKKADDKPKADAPKDETKKDAPKGQEKPEEKPQDRTENKTPDQGATKPAEDAGKTGDGKQAEKAEKPAEDKPAEQKTEK